MLKPVDAGIAAAAGTRPDPYGRPFPAIAAALLALLGPFAALVPLGMAPLLISLGVLAGGSWLLRGGRPAPDRPLLLAFGLFYAAGILSLAWTPVPKDGLAQVITFAYELVPGYVLLAAAGGIDAERRRRLVTVALASVLAGLALFSLEVLFDQPIYRWAKQIEGTVVAQDRAINRPAVIFGVLVWPVALMLRRRGLGVAAWLLPAAYLVLSYWTTSQSAAVGMAAGLLVLALSSLSARVGRAAVAGLLVAGFVLAVPLSHRLYDSGLAQAEWLPFSFRHRIEIWDFTAERIAEKPLLGWGLDSSRAIPNAGRSSSFLDGNIVPLHPHNLFLQSLLELGVVGSAFLLALGLVLVRRTKRLPEDAQPAALACFAAAVVIGCFAYGAWQTWWICSLLTAAFLLLLAAGDRPAGASKISAFAEGSPARRA